MCLYKPSTAWGSFDNFGSSVMIVFEVIVVDNWSQTMYDSIGAVGTASFLYYLGIILVATYVLLFLATAVISFRFTDVFRRAVMQLEASLNRSFSTKVKDLVERRMKEERTTGWLLARRFYENIATQIVIFAVIVIQMVCISLEGESLSTTNRRLIDSLNTGLLYAFAVELFVKVLAYSPRVFADDKTTTLDLILVTLSFLDQYLFYQFSLPYLYSLRLLRLLAIMRNVKSLYTIAHIFYYSCYDARWIGFLLFLFLSTFTLVGHMLFRGVKYNAEVTRIDFNSLPSSFASVFQLLLIDDWADAVYESVSDGSGWTVLYFLFLAVVGNLVLLNLLLAVFISGFEFHLPQGSQSNVHDRQAVIGDVDDWINGIKHNITVLVHRKKANKPESHPINKISSARARRASRRGSVALHLPSGEITGERRPGSSNPWRNRPADIDIASTPAAPHGHISLSTPGIKTDDSGLSKTSTQSDLAITPPQSGKLGFLDDIPAVLSVNVRDSSIVAAESVSDMSPHGNQFAGSMSPDAAREATSGLLGDTSPEARFVTDLLGDSPESEKRPSSSRRKTVSIVDDDVSIQDTSTVFNGDTSMSSLASTSHTGGRRGTLVSVLSSFGDGALKVGKLATAVKAIFSKSGAGALVECDSTVTKMLHARGYINAFQVPTFVREARASEDVYHASDKALDWGRVYFHGATPCVALGGIDSANLMKKRVQPLSSFSLGGASSAVAMGGYTHTAIKSHDASLFLFAPTGAFREAAFTLSSSRAFVTLGLVMVILNTCILALDSPTHPFKYFSYLSTVNFALNILFGCELLVHLVAKGGFTDIGYLRSPWNFIDMCIIVAVLVTMILPRTSSIQVILVLRILRPFRVIVRHKGMQIILKTLLYSLPGTINVGIIIFFVLFVFGTAAHQLFSNVLNSCTDQSVRTRVDCVGFFTDSTGNSSSRKWIPDRVNFDTVWNSVLSLFVISTLSSWAGITKRASSGLTPDTAPVFENTDYLKMLFFIVFTVIMAFLMLNMFIGVIIFNFNTVNLRMSGLLYLTDQQHLWLSTQRILLTFRPQKRLLVSSRNPTVLKLHGLITNSTFITAMTTIVAIHMLILCTIHHNMDEWWRRAVLYCNWGFTIVYAIEWFMQFTVYRRSYFRPSWKRFELLLLVLNIALLATEALHEFTSVFSGAPPLVFTAIRFGWSINIVRIAVRHHELQLLLATLGSATPALANTGVFVIVLILIYSILGVELFWNVSGGAAVNDLFNFSNTATASLTLFRIATFDNWHHFLYDTMSPVSCASATARCGTYWAPLYFTTYIVLVSYISLNICIAVLLDNFNAIMTIDASTVPIDHYMKFIELWADYDPEGKGEVNAHDFLAIQKRLLPPLGLPKSIHRVELLRRCKKNSAPYYNGKFLFHECLISCARVALGVNMTESEVEVQVRGWRERRGRRDTREFCMYRWEIESLHHAYAAMWLNSFFKCHLQMKRTNQLRKTLFLEQAKGYGYTPEQIRIVMKTPLYKQRQPKKDESLVSDNAAVRRQMVMEVIQKEEAEFADNDSDTEGEKDNAFMKFQQEEEQKKAILQAKFASHRKQSNLKSALRKDSGHPSSMSSMSASISQAWPNGETPAASPSCDALPSNSPPFDGSPSAIFDGSPSEARRKKKRVTLSETVE